MRIGVLRMGRLFHIQPAFQQCKTNNQKGSSYKNADNQQAVQYAKKNQRRARHPYGNGTTGLICNGNGQVEAYRAESGLIQPGLAKYLASYPISSRLRKNARVLLHIFRTYRKVINEHLLRGVP